MPHLEHIGIAVEAPDAVAGLYEALLDVASYKTETVAEQKVRTHFISARTAKLELLEATDDDSPVAHFLERRGEGLHHLAFEVENLEAVMERCRALDLTPLSEAPRPGADGKRIFFLHPQDTHGVLVEFCQSTPVPLEPAFVPYQGSRLAVYTAGASGASPVLILHGAAGCTPLETAGLVRRLEPNYRVVAVDFSGHGASTHTEAFSADLFADNARAALDYAGIEQADVFGFSMGGTMALHFAHQHPERVRRLALHGACIEWDEARVAAMNRRLDADAIAARRPQLADQLAKLHTDWQALFRRMQAFTASLPARSDALATITQTIEHPTLVSAVDRDDLFPLDAPLGLHDLLSNSRLALLPGDQHALQTVNVELLVSLLRTHFSEQGKNRMEDTSVATDERSE